MIREMRFEVPLWINWFAKRALKSRSELIDSRNALWSPALKQLTRETRFEVPLWNNWLVKRALKSRSETNDSWNALWSPARKQMIRDPIGALQNSESFCGVMV